MKEKVLKSSTGNSVITLPSNVLSSISKLAEKQLTRTKREVNNCPEYPGWVQDRPFLSWDFYPNTEKFESVNIFN